MTQARNRAQVVHGLLRGSEYVLALVGSPARRDQARLQVGLVYLNRRAVADHSGWGLFPEGSLLLGRLRGNRPPYLVVVVVRRGRLVEVDLEAVSDRIPWSRLLQLLRGRVRRRERGYRSRKKALAAEGPRERESFQSVDCD